MKSELQVRFAAFSNLSSFFLLFKNLVLIEISEDSDFYRKLDNHTTTTMSLFLSLFVTGYFYPPASA